MEWPQGVWAATAPRAVTPGTTASLIFHQFMIENYVCCDLKKIEKHWIKKTRIQAYTPKKETTGYFSEEYPQPKGKYLKTLAVQQSTHIIL